MPSGWWDSEQCCEHITRLTGGEPDTCASAPVRAAVRRVAGAHPCSVSNGCGTMGKELELLRDGYLWEAEGYDHNRDALTTAHVQSCGHGLRDRVTLCAWGAMERDISPADVVLWFDSLHHMPDQAAALAWSRRTAPAIVCDEYVGPNRFQYSPTDWEIICDYWTRLPDEWRQKYPGLPPYPDAEYWRAADPTEAQASADILPAFRAEYPGGTVIHTGGLLYHGMMEQAWPFVDLSRPAEDALLGLVLEWDEALMRDGHSFRAVMYAGGPE